MLHFPRQILAAGPLIRKHCFRFEAKHNYFKSIALIQNFKNMTLSIAERCQKLDCSGLSDKSGETHPLFKLDTVKLDKTFQAYHVARCEVDVSKL